MMTEHAMLPPSAGKEWTNCHGWLPLNALSPPEEQTPEAEWGDQAHAMAAPAIMDAARTGQFKLPDCDDNEMSETVRFYVNHCLNLMRSTSCFTPLVEHRVDTGHSLHAEVWGTCDFILYDPVNKVLYIRDFKTGRILIEADDPQLIIYAIGAIQTLELDDQEITVNLGVVQPRGYHHEGSVRTRKFKGYELRGLANQYHAAAEANLRGGKLKTGTHCYQCSARLNCPAHIEAAQMLPEIIKLPIVGQPSSIAKGLLLKQTKRAIKYLEQLEKILETHVEADIKNVPGWNLEPAYARSKDWLVSEDQIVALGTLLGKDFQKKSVVTPAQAIALGAPEDIVKSYSTRRKVGVKLVETKDVSYLFGE